MALPQLEGDRSPTQARTALTPDGRLMYAVGDVHGRLDLLEALLAEILRDVLRSEPEVRPLVIFLGDYIDRGYDSRGVLQLLIAVGESSALDARFLLGNHEQAALHFLDDAATGAIWASYGGDATLSSYGVKSPKPGAPPAEWEATRASFRAALPPAHRAFLEGLELMVIAGDYAFVHAGVRPGAAFDRQTERDVLWIREEFLTCTTPFEKVVVHGHTPSDRPELTANRIGLDTGAYATGVLTAVRLEQETQTIIQATLGRQPN